MKDLTLSRLKLSDLMLGGSGGQADQFHWSYLVAKDTDANMYVSKRDGVAWVLKCSRYGATAHSGIAIPEVEKYVQ